MLKVGLQGNLGSSNHRAALRFAKQHHWTNYELIPLTTTQGVLDALAAKTIDLGTFAWESRTGLVAETQAALGKHGFRKVDELRLDINHAILVRDGTAFDPTQPVVAISHPQALKSHRDFLLSHFPRVELRDEVDTAYAAEQLAAGAYPPNAAVIAPIECAELYGVEILLEYLPSNEGLWTTIFLVSAADEL